MSVVYIVLDDFSQKRFAVKTLKEEMLDDRTAIDRFAQEARTWMNLGRHPHIVEAIIYREIQGQPFLFLDYVEGVSLGQLIDAEETIRVPGGYEFDDIETPDEVDETYGYFKGDAQADGRKLTVSERFEARRRQIPPNGYEGFKAAVDEMMDWAATVYRAEKGGAS